MVVPVKTTASTMAALVPTTFSGQIVTCVSWTTSLDSCQFDKNVYQKEVYKRRLYQGVSSCDYTSLEETTLLAPDLFTLDSLSLILFSPDISATMCNSYPCLNDGSCQPSDAGDSYSCHCGLGFSGENCESESEYVGLTFIVPVISPSIYPFHP